MAPLGGATTSSTSGPCCQDRGPLAATTQLGLSIALRASDPAPRRRHARTRRLLNEQMKLPKKHVMARSGPPIVTSAVRLERGADEWTLSCRVDAPGLGVPERFFYTVHGPAANEVELSACPFVPPLVLLAAYNSRDLIIEAPVSQVLLDRLRGVLALWHQRDRNAKAIDVTAVPVALTRRASAAASFSQVGSTPFTRLLTPTLGTVLQTRGSYVFSFFVRASTFPSTIFAGRRTCALTSSGRHAISEKSSSP